MCGRCNYLEMLSQNGVEPTPLREAVFKSIGDESKPLAAIEIMETVKKHMTLNKVTVYRILDLLVEKGLVKRLSAGDRTFRYGMGASAHHPDHAHFVCTRCGEMECLAPEVVPRDFYQFKRQDVRHIEQVDVRFEGICENCQEASS
jgi:Fur family ferric uptake transcriptional regulator